MIKLKLFSSLATLVFVLSIGSCQSNTGEKSSDCLVHDFGEWITNPASCTEDGNMERVCKDCGEKEEIVLPALGHDYSGNLYGYNEYSHWKVCSRCGEADSNVSAHTFGSNYSISSEGHYQACEVCLYQTKPSAHIWNRGVVTSEATCIDSEITTYTCSLCGDTYSVATSPALGHDYSIYTYIDSETHSVKCSRCDATLIEEHSYKYGIQDPTCTEYGHFTFTCSCGNQITYDNEEPLGHEIVGELTYDSETDTWFGDCSRCGETLPLDDTPSKSGIFNVSTQESLQLALTLGGEVNLTNDIELTSSLIVSGDVTINLNGYTISNGPDSWIENNDFWSLLSIQNGVEVAILGNGRLDSYVSDIYAIDVRDESMLTIENGTYIGNTKCVYVSSGDVTIDGGTFALREANSTSNEEYKYLLDLDDNAFLNELASITLCGGSYINFDPTEANGPEVSGEQTCEITITEDYYVGQILEKETEDGTQYIEYVVELFAHNPKDMITKAHDTENYSVHIDAASYVGLTSMTYGDYLEDVQAGNEYLLSDVELYVAYQIDIYYMEDCVLIEEYYYFDDEGFTLVMTEVLLNDTDNTYWDFYTYNGEGWYRSHRETIPTWQDMYYNLFTTAYNRNSGDYFTYVESGDDYDEYQISSTIEKAYYFAALGMQFLLGDYYALDYGYFYTHEYTRFYAESQMMYSSFYNAGLASSDYTITSTSQVYYIDDEIRATIYDVGHTDVRDICYYYFSLL